MISRSIDDNGVSGRVSDEQLELQDLRISDEQLEDMVESCGLGSKVVRGYDLLLEGELERSSEIFDEVIEEDRSVAEVWYGKGLISLLTEDLDAALQYFEKAISLKPDFKDALYEKGVALHEKGRTKEAMEYWKRSREKEKSY